MADDDLLLASGRGGGTYSLDFSGLTAGVTATSTGLFDTPEAGNRATIVATSTGISNRALRLQPAANSQTGTNSIQLSNPNGLYPFYDFEWLIVFRYFNQNTTSAPAKFSNTTGAVGVTTDTVTGMVAEMGASANGASAVDLVGYNANSPNGVTVGPVSGSDPWTAAQTYSLLFTRVGNLYTVKRWLRSNAESTAKSSTYTDATKAYAAIPSNYLDVGMGAAASVNEYIEVYGLSLGTEGNAALRL